MTLYGSITSPFVRRLRFVLHELGIPFDLIDSLSDAGQAAMRTKNPIWKVPCVEIDGQILWDSHTIIEYLTEKNAGNPKLLRQPQGAEKWREKNLVTAADGCVESAINVFYLRKDGVEVDKVAYLVKQRARVESILTWLKTQLRDNYFTAEKKIGLSELTFYCILDWLRFREMYPVLQDPVLKAYMEFHSKYPAIEATKPPG
ncbi:MAG: glutathione S-transferase family protein [Turneriella sp.]|nr:glutathione S-transferase family protein [Turneriella sp.]